MHPLADLIITPDIVRLIAEIDEFKGRWQALGDLAPERLSGLRRVATIESVGSSTRIEGVQLTDSQVETLLSRLEGASFHSRDEQEVAGYAAVMELVFGAWREITLTESHVQQLHRDMLRESSRDEHHRGRYKTIANSIEAFDSSGRSLGTIFETATPFETPQLMKALVRWTATALAEGKHHPLLIIAAFIVRFLAIHPFQDGNGRLSRVLTMLLLLRSGYEYVPFSSLEHIVEENKDAYYRTLRRAQATLDQGEENLGEWVIFLLTCLKLQKDRLAKKLEVERALAPSLPPLGEELLKLARHHGRLTLQAAVVATGANRNTLKSHLRRLVAEGRLTRHGRGRATWYKA